MNTTPNPTPAQPPATERGEHTPGEWKVRKDRRKAHPSTIMCGAMAIASCNEYVREVEANAAHIVHCVNTRAALEAENAELKRQLALAKADLSREVTLDIPFDVTPRQRAGVAIFQARRTMPDQKPWRCVGHTEL